MTTEVAVSAARTCDGAFSSPSSTCSQPQPSPTIRSSATSRSRPTAGSACSWTTTPAVVCGIQTTAAAASRASPSASRTFAVISSAWVLRSVLSSNSRNTAGYPTRPMATVPVGSGTVDAFRDEADRFVAALDHELLLHYGGHKETLDLEPIYERFSDLTTLETCRTMEA